MNRDRLKKQLIVDEDKRNKAYRCSAGFLSIGVGRNLDANGLRDSEIDFMLENDINEVAAQLDKALPWWRQMSDSRQEALCNLCFNLGIAGLLKFKTSLSLLRDGNYEAAAAAFQDSLWFKQVGQRAVRVVSAIRQG